MENINSKYVSLSALARGLGLPSGYLKDLAEKKQIPSLQINRRLRFNPEAVQSALDELAAKGGDDEK